MSMKIRKLAVWVEETHEEGGRAISPPTRKAVAAAVIENPYAGKYVEDLSELMEFGAELGGILGEKCVTALGIEPHQAESYGKAAMVGENGELEHAAAILHPRMGAPLRKAVESYERPLRVAVFGTGGMSHQLQAERAGLINREFDNRFLDLLIDDPDKAAAITHTEYLREAGSEGIELVMWLVMRGALDDKVTAVHRHYHVPASNTAVGHLVLENKAAAMAEVA